MKKMWRPKVMLKSLVLLAAAGWLAVSNLAGCAGANVVNASQTRAGLRSGTNARKTLRAFGSEQELAAYFRRVAEEAKREMERRRALARRASGNVAGTAAPPPASSPVDAADAVSMAKEDKAEED